MFELVPSISKIGFFVWCHWLTKFGFHLTIPKSSCHSNGGLGRFTLGSFWLNRFEQFQWDVFLDLDQPASTK